MVVSEAFALLAVECLFVVVVCEGKIASVRWRRGGLFCKSHLKVRLQGVGWRNQQLTPVESTDSDQVTLSSGRAREQSFACISNTTGVLLAPCSPSATGPSCPCPHNVLLHNVAASKARVYTSFRPSRGIRRCSNHSTDCLRAMSPLGNTVIILLL